MKESEMVIGKVYKYCDNLIFEYNCTGISINEINTKDETFTKKNFWTFCSEHRLFLANEDEIRWQRACAQAQSFIPFSQIQTIKTSFEANFNNNYPIF